MLPDLRHWRLYLIEAVCLGLFMVSACVFSTLIFHPAGAWHRALPTEPARRVAMGALMGLTAMALIYSRWGRRSGAHMNPATTLTFLRLGKVSRRDATGYVAAQFAGGVTGVVLARALVGAALAQPAVNFAVTVPGPLGPWPAFVAESVISALLIFVVLRATSSPRVAPYAGVMAGLLVWLFIAVESPISGMSMNPARSFGSAAVAGHWVSLWIYFAAPLLGMLAAAEVHVRRGRAALGCAKFMHEHPCIFCEYRASQRS